MEKLLLGIGLGIAAAVLGALLMFLIATVCFALEDQQEDERPKGEGYDDLGGWGV